MKSVVLIYVKDMMHAFIDLSYNLICLYVMSQKIDVLDLELFIRGRSQS